MIVASEELTPNANSLLSVHISHSLLTTYKEKLTNKQLIFF